MENQEQEETSLEYFWDKVWKNTELYEEEYIAISGALKESKKMYEIEIAKAYEKGISDANKLTDEENKFPS